MFKQLTLSSPGKIVLCGEHSVVYGKKALACSINLRTYLNADYSMQTKNFKLNLKNLEKNIEITETEFNLYKNEASRLENLDLIIENLEKYSFNKHLNSVKIFIYSLPNLKWSNLESLNVEINSKIPLAFGLGSSASYSVCLSGLFLILSEMIKPGLNNKLEMQDLELINKYAFYVEKLFHGRPSGIDNSVSTFGNYILFEKGTVLDRFDSKLDIELLIISSGVPKQTLEQVKRVRELYNRNESILENLMNGINGIVEKFVSSLKNNFDSNLNELINLNQGVLYSLQVSCNELNDIVNISARNGFSCKITGGGGGGCCFCLLGNKSSERVCSLIQELHLNNYLSFKTKLGSNGFLIEKFD